MTSFLDRNGATEFVREKGVPVGDSGFANMASDEKGPRYSIINGRALYKRDDLIEWINQQASAVPRRRRRALEQRAAQQPSAA